MSKFRVLIPVSLNDFRDRLPAQCHIDSIRLIDPDKNGAVEVVFDDPSQKSPYTFPKDVTFMEFYVAGNQRIAEKAAADEKALQEEQRLVREAEAQLKAEEAAAAAKLAAEAASVAAPAPTSPGEPVQEAPAEATKPVANAKKGKGK